MFKLVFSVVLIVLLSGCLSGGQASLMGKASSSSTIGQSADVNSKPPRIEPPSQLKNAILLEEERSNQAVFQPGQVQILSFKTDRSLYHSQELMNITASVKVLHPMRNVVVAVRGILSGGLRPLYRLEKDIIANLSEGENALSVQYTTPSCTGCAGISPGNYSIRLMLISDGRPIANSTSMVEIVQ